MNVYIVKVKNGEPRNLSNLLFPFFMKLEIGKSYEYSKVKRNKYGKPIAIAKHHFNISHSRTYWSIAFSGDTCGIDIEDADARAREGLKRKILNPNEQLFKDSVLHTWVLKEAFLKYVGLGLCLNFKSFTTTSIFEKANVGDLSSSDYICYCVNKKNEPIKITVASWDGSQVDFDAKM